MRKLILKVLLLNFGIASVAAVVWVIYASGSWTKQLDEFISPISSSWALSFGIVLFIAIGLALINYWIIYYGRKQRAITISSQRQKKYREGRTMSNEIITGFKTICGFDKGLKTIFGLEGGLKASLGLDKESQNKLRTAKRIEDESDEGIKPILIVEDETIMRESVRDWLSDIGYQVETAEDGERALEILEKQDFGLLILDLKLPGKDGIQVLREARVKRPKLRGIIITAYPSVETAVEAIKDGAIEYLPKPFELNRLERLIQDVLGPVQLEIRPKVVTKE